MPFFHNCLEKKIIRKIQPVLEFLLDMVTAIKMADLENTDT